MTFKLVKGKSVILMTIYVDDGLCAMNDHDLYKKFLSDLAKEFELSDQGKCKWYLGVNIEQDLANRRTKISQKQYVKDVLARFGMTGATPVSTPMEPNTHLTREDCPPEDKCDK